MGPVASATTIQTLINQMRSALVGTYPAFEHVLRGQMIHRKWILHLLAKYGGPTKIRRVGRTRLAAFARSHKARNSEPVIDAMLAAIHAQTVSIAGAEYAELGVAMSAKDALAKLEQSQRNRGAGTQAHSRRSSDRDSFIHARHRPA